MHRFEYDPVEIDNSKCSLTNMGILESGTWSNSNNTALIALMLTSHPLGMILLLWCAFKQFWLEQNESVGQWHIHSNGTKWRENDMH